MMNLQPSRSPSHVQSRRSSTTSAAVRAEEEEGEEKQTQQPPLVRVAVGVVAAAVPLDLIFFSMTLWLVIKVAA